MGYFRRRTRAGGREHCGGAGTREVREEAGIRVLPGECEFLHEYIMRSAVEEEYVYSFRLLRDEGFVKQDSEIDELKFFTVAEIQRRIGTGFFTPNFEDEFRRVISENIKNDQVC